MTRRPVILVVDDEPKNVRLLEAILTFQGYDVVGAENGEQCLESVKRQSVDLILLDVMMPGIDGFEVMRVLRADPRHRLIPTVLLTALDATEDRVRGIEAGCDDFISKPFDKNELLARIRTLLTLSYYRRQLDEKEKLEVAITAARDGIIVCSPDWRIQKANPAAKRFFELKDEAEASLLDFMRRRYRFTVPRRDLDDIETAPGEFELIREETEHFRGLQLHVSVAVIRDPSGKASSVIVSVHDVTDLVRDQRLKQDFVSLISHKLRTPLTPIMLYLSLIKDKTVTGDELDGTVDQVLLQVKRMHALVERLIEFVSATQNSHERGGTVVAVREELERIVESFGRGDTTQGRVALKAGKENPLVEIQPSLLGLVVVNLIENGLKFNDSDDPRVVLSVATKGDWAVVSVADNGLGIPPEQQGRIFEEFTQLEKDFTGAVPGIGLGLTIVHRIVSSYGGQVEVESGLGSGSTLTVTLPRAKARATHAQPGPHPALSDSSRA